MLNKDKVIASLRKKASMLGVSYNVVQRRFFYDSFLRLIAQSQYRDHFMLKGGMLLNYRQFNDCLFLLEWRVLFICWDF